MTTLDHDDPCYDMFQCDPSLECDSHVESEFYVSRIHPDRVVLCCHCAGTMLDSPVELHTHLKAPEGSYRIVLPICKACLNSGCHIIVHHARQNANAKQAKLDAERAREILRQERATNSAKESSNSVAHGVDSSGEEVHVVEEAEEEHATAPRRSRRKTRNASPRYVEHVSLIIALCFAHVVCT